MEALSGNGDGLADKRRWERVAVAAIVLGAAARLVWVLVVHPPYEYVYSDMEGYVSRAQRLAGGADLVRYDAFAPPGTHMLLAAPLTLFGTGAEGLRAAAAEWWLLSSLVPLLAWRLALRLFDPRTAALTAAAAAAYPLFVFYGGVFTSETPALALLLGSLLLGCRAQAASGRVALFAATGAGVLGAAAIATRPQLILNVAVLALPFLWRRLWLPAGALALGAGLVLAGIVVHNSAAAGKLTGVSESGGINFFQSHCDAHRVDIGGYFYASPVPVALDNGTDYRFPSRDPWDQGFLYGEGLDCVRADGLGHASLLAGNLIDTTATTIPWPLGDSSTTRTTARVTNLAMAPALAIIVLLTLFSVRRGQAPELRRARVWLLLHLACLVPLVLVFTGEPRYRVPYDVFALMLLASLVAARSAPARSAPDPA